MNIESKTKEQICIERGLLTYLGTLAPIFAEAMEEYAKQQALAFTYWHRGSIAQIYMPNGDRTWDIVRPSPIYVENEKITDDQLYELFSHSIDNKQPYTPDQLKEAINTVLGPVKSKNKQ